ncbi:lectin [Armillaria fumosa]|nr:lectin [Armillaria fumosa]
MFAKALLLLLTTAFYATDSLVAGTTTPDHASLAARDGHATFQPLTLTNSNWVWTGWGGGQPREDKCAVCATILIATDDFHTLYVNGAEIGSGASYTSAQVYTVGLKRKSKNGIAINATNTGGPAGMIATVLVDYSDSSTETFVTDASWKTTKSVPPPELASPRLDDSSWMAASEEGKDGIAPWGQTSLPPALDITQSNWIWTKETDSAGNAPIGHRAFRKTITSPSGKCAVCAKVVLAVHNAYTVYANGASLGSGTDFHIAQAYSVRELHPDQNVFALDGENTSGPAGAIATILVAYNDGTSTSYVTNSSWKAFEGLPDGFQSPRNDDSEWSDAAVLNRYDVGPQGSVTVPPA